MAKKTPQAEDAFRLRRHSILVGGALRVVLGEVEIIFQELFVTIRSALLQLLPVSDTFLAISSHSSWKGRLQRTAV